MTSYKPLLIHSFLAHQDGTTSLSFSPDGQVLATGGYDSALRLWNANSWEALAVLPGHRRGHVAFSPEGTLIVSGGLHRNATVYDATSLKKVRTLYRTSGVWDLSFDPKSSRLAIIQPDDESDPPVCPIEFRDSRTWRSLGTLYAGAFNVHAVAFSPDGEQVAKAVGAVVGIWKADFTWKRQEFKAHLRATWGLAFSPDGMLLASGGADNVARVWDTATWQILHELLHQELSADVDYDNAVLCAAFSPDGGTLATGGLDGLVNIWELATL